MLMGLLELKATSKETLIESPPPCHHLLLLRIASLPVDKGGHLVDWRPFDCWLRCSRNEYNHPSHSRLVSG